jgi:hypothetical protein
MHDRGVRGTDMKALPALPTAAQMELLKELHPVVDALADRTAAQYHSCCPCLCCHHVPSQSRVHDRLRAHQAPREMRPRGQSQGAMRASECCGAGSSSMPHYHAADAPVGPKVAWNQCADLTHSLSHPQAASAVYSLAVATITGCSEGMKVGV